ncbi:MAG: hypothetical protein GKR96_12445 [Gammaproteobacteria bacterium]|nr:hypothetical protein [Gammaproteobacteria bacterium]
MGWQNLEVADALDSIAATGDAKARTADIAKVTRILHEELPLNPIVWYQHTISIASGLKGVIIDPLQRSYNLSELFWGE